MAKTLDKKRDYATVHGKPGVAFEQDGNYFDFEENLVGEEAGGEKPLKVAEVVELIAKAETTEAVDEIVGDDTRAGVLKAAAARKAELE